MLAERGDLELPHQAAADYFAVFTLGILLVFVFRAPSGGSPTHFVLGGLAQSQNSDGAVL